MHGPVREEEAHGEPAMGIARGLVGLSEACVTVGEDRGAVA